MLQCNLIKYKFVINVHLHLCQKLNSCEVVIGNKLDFRFTGQCREKAQVQVFYVLYLVPQIIQLFWDHSGHLLE